MPGGPTALGAENIGPHERRKRATVGAVALIVGLGALALLLYVRAPRALRLGLFLPFWFAGLGWYQSRART